MLNWSLIKYKNTIIKHYIYAQEQNMYSCIYKIKKIIFVTVFVTVFKCL